MSDQITQAQQFRVFSTLGQSFALLFRNFVPFVLLAIIMMSPPYIYLYIADPNFLAEDPIYVAISLIEIILSYFVMAVLVFGVFQSLRGQPVSIFACVTRGIAVFFPVIGVVVIMGLIWAAVGLLGFGAMWVLPPGGGSMILPIVLMILAIYISVILWGVVPAAAVEGRVLSSFGRSLYLTKGNRWRILGMLILVGIITGGIGQIGTSVGEAIGSNSSVLLLTWAATALTSAFSAVVVTVAYYRLTLEKDGIPEDQIAAVFD